MVYPIVEGDKKWESKGTTIWCSRGPSLGFGTTGPKSDHYCSIGFETSEFGKVYNVLKFNFDINKKKFNFDSKM